MEAARVIVVAPDGPSASALATTICAAAGLSLDGLVRGHPTLVVLSQRPQADDDARRLVDSLSQRERQVLQELVDGRSVKDAAVRLEVSANTVRTHVKHVLAKLRVDSSLQAASLAVRSGMRPTAVVEEPGRPGVATLGVPAAGAEPVIRIP